VVLAERVLAPAVDVTTTPPTTAKTAAYPNNDFLMVPSPFSTTFLRQTSELASRVTRIWDFSVDQRQ
jgi:hypothetical protein